MPWRIALAGAVARPAGRAVGIACGTEKGSYVATAAEVSRTADGFTVDRIVIAFECGSIVNPDGLRNQVEGSVVQGLGGALFEAIQFRNGKLLNGTMADYRVPRFKDVPPIDIILLDRPDLPSAGAGETPIVCVAPAIGTAARSFGTVAGGAARAACVARLPVSRSWYSLRGLWPSARRLSSNSVRIPGTASTWVRSRRCT